MITSPTSNEAPSASGPSVGPALVRLLYILVIVALLAIGSGGKGWDIGFLVVTGWIGFLTRTVPRISWNWDLIVTGLLCCIAVLALAHFLLRSLAAPILKPTAATGGEVRTWRWRWTWCGVAALGVLFLVGMCAGGIVHQVAWIRSSPEPWFEYKSGLSFAGEMKNFRLVMTMAANDHNDDITRMRVELRDPKGEWTRRRHGEPTPYEKFICLLIVDDARKFAGAILFPRDPEQWKRRHVLYHWTNTEDEWLSMRDLPELLKRYEGHLLTL